MRIAMMDLETTNLAALMGTVLCGCVKPLGEEPKTYRRDVGRYRVSGDPIDDSKLVVAIRDELENYNMVVTWNGKGFDKPFLNARLAYHGERPWQPQFHLDMMYYAAGGSTRIGSRKLVNVQKFFGLGESKTEITWNDWQRAATLNTDAMNEVAHHCAQDVKVLEEAYWKLLPFVANIHR